jgi:hypothetical protein
MMTDFEKQAQEQKDAIQECIAVINRIDGQPARVEVAEWLANAYRQAADGK